MNASSSRAQASRPLLADLVQSIRSQYPAEHALRLQLGDVSIEFRTDCAPLCETLRHYFGEFIATNAAGAATLLVTAHETGDAGLPVVLPGEFQTKDPDPGKNRIKEKWMDLPDGRVVRKRLTGMHFLFGPAGNVAVGPCLANDNQVINFINNRFLEYKLNRGCLLGHAAGIMHAGRGLALAGFSGMGKSTLALHLMSKGTTFVSNDRVLLSTQTDGMPVMYGIPKQPRINPGTALNNPDLAGIIAEADRERFLALPTTELWNLEHKYDAIIEECYGSGRFVLQAPMYGLVILNWTRNGDPLTVRRVDLYERRDLLPAFMKSTGLFYRPDVATYEDPSDTVYAEALSRTTILEMSGGVDFDAAAEACLAFLENGTL